MRSVTRNRLTTVVLATAVFALVGFSVTRALNMPIEIALIGAPLLGLLISSFEVFYFQTHRGVSSQCFATDVKSTGSDSTQRSLVWSRLPTTGPISETRVRPSLSELCARYLCDNGCGGHFRSVWELKKSWTNWGTIRLSRYTS